MVAGRDAARLGADPGGTPARAVPRRRGSGEPARSPDGSKASKDARGDADLRLLTTPVARYAPSKDGRADGAIFLRLVEARDPGAGPRRAYAFAPMTGRAAKGGHRGREGWSVPRRYPGYDPRQP